MIGRGWIKLLPLDMNLRLGTKETAGAKGVKLAITRVVAAGRANNFSRILDQHSRKLNSDWR